MKYERREPCPNCPFRTDAPLAYWAPEEYVRLADLERVEGQPESATASFGCHKDRHGPVEDRQYCVGWLVHQRERGVPSIALRFALVASRDREAVVEQFEQAKVPDGVALYPSVQDLVAANLRRDRVIHPERYEDDEEP